MKKPREKGPVDYRVGVHTSVAGGLSLSVERAAALDCNTMQVFSHSPRQWKKPVISSDEIGRFSGLRNKYDIGPVFIHASYLINLDSDKKTIRDKSEDLLRYELETADALGAEYVVLHAGVKPSEDFRSARERIAEAVVRAVSDRDFKAGLLLENTATKAVSPSFSIESLAGIYELCACRNIAGICIDTCHAFASGYDLVTPEGLDGLLSDIDRLIGLDKLRLIHLNDAKKPCGSGLDRHEDIGRGHIGIHGFKNILSNEKILRNPLILETPKSSEEDDFRNLETVRDILSGF